MNIYTNDDNSIEIKIFRNLNLPENNYILLNQSRIPILKSNVINENYYTIELTDTSVLKIINDTQVIYQKKGILVILNQIKKNESINMVSGDNFAISNNEHIKFKITKSKYLKLYTNYIMFHEKESSNVVKSMIIKQVKLGTNYTQILLDNGSVLRISSDNSFPHYYNDIQIEKQLN
jgi:hypothetical protein